MRGRILFLAALAGMMTMISLPVRAADSGKQPSPELRSLEREVSLKIAHLSDEGETDPARRAQLRQAQQLDTKAEQALAAGAYDTAEENLVKANAILGQLGM